MSTDQTTHADRRERFAALIGDGIAVLPAATEATTSSMSFAKTATASSSQGSRNQMP